jgi:hypothetical protein
MFILSFARIMYGSNQQSRVSNQVHHAALWAEPARLELHAGWGRAIWRKQSAAEEWLRSAAPAWLSKAASIFLPHR